MAKKENGSVKKAKPSFPAGYVPARQSLDGFFERSEGNTAQGILRGSFRVKGKFGEKNVYRIELTVGETLVGEGEMMGPGAVIGLDETGYTKVLGELEPGTGVFIRYEGKGPAEKDAHIYSVGRAE